MSLSEQDLRTDSERNQFEDEDFRVIQSFIHEEQLYLKKLKKLQVARTIIQFYQAPETDLKCLFGSLDQIIVLHECVLATRLEACRSLEDLLDIFANQIDLFRIYIHDQWVKSRNEFHGKQALLKARKPSRISFFFKLKSDSAFQKLDLEDVSNLNLPEAKIIEYIRFHERLKSCRRVKNTELLLKSLQALKKLILQRKYAQGLASVESLPYSADGFVHFVDNFQVKIDNARFTPYRIYVCTNYMYFVTDAMCFDFDISNREISLNPMEEDELSFELTTRPGNRVFIFKSETSTIKNAWTELLRDILYTQAEEEKLKILNSVKFK